MVAFSYVIQYVRDVKQTSEFYTNVFGFSVKFITPELDYAELSTGGTTLAFATYELGMTNISRDFVKVSPDGRPFGIELVFATDDVSAMVDTARSHGAVLEEAPVQKPWGQTVAYLRDPNGFLIEICTPMGSQ